MLRPFTIARYGIFLAVAAALMSVWLGRQAGASLDYAVLRAVFVFLIFTAIAFAAEAILSVNVPPRAASNQAPAHGPKDEEDR
ncbi:MAG: hypothetical protein C0506_10490 [Anaerolinea sp.]|nr:hypothetical protein [Anaerolinea sp.]